VHPSVEPLAIVGPAVLPLKTALAVLLAVEPLTLITSTVLPAQLTFAVHIVKEPLALVGFLVWPNVLPFPRDFVLKELTFVHRAIGEFNHAHSFFVAVTVGTLVLCAIRPRFGPLAMLFVLEPLACVSRSIVEFVDPKAVSFVIETVSFINVTVRT